MGDGEGEGDGLLRNCAIGRAGTWILRWVVFEIDGE